MNTEDIMKLYASAPDFDEKKTRYQVEHITGRISGVQYTPPECSTMKSYNICFDADDLCRRDWMKHPLTYYRVKSKDPGKKKGRRGVKSTSKKKGPRQKGGRSVKS